MALTITVLNATQDMLRLSAASNGEGGDTASLTQAELVALCAAGPLKSLLTSPTFEGPPGPGVATWANLIEDGRLSVYTSCVGTSPVGVAFNFLASPSRFTIGTDNAGTGIVEFNFRHSINR